MITNPVHANNTTEDEDDIPLGEFDFSVIALDQGPDGAGRESFGIPSGAFVSHLLTADSPNQVVPGGDFTYVMATSRATAADKPTAASALTLGQLRRSVGFVFSR